MAYISQRLKTNMFLHKFKLRDPFCGDCPGEAESVLHVLRDCTVAKETWQVLLHPKFPTIFFSLSHDDWIETNMNQNLGSQGMDWQAL